MTNQESAFLMQRQLGTPMGTCHIFEENSKLILRDKKLTPDTNLKKKHRSKARFPWSRSLTLSIDVWTTKESFNVPDKNLWSMHK